ncbi:hypothetical protein SIN8267_01595 [Sinobacterium norvegicum]|uniref:Periplasmic nitrate reductase, NapE protein n=1 Tax=Sinobacterium norvegicum TaxID=1641715 RepID=A0ABM9AE55_9GAMM|nr:periplasmic nitrate reductase, NapE protein [Sinobacterium norvegicum]CAH0991489.1 hypothetical protein SIN8267_01595 [Sinobacterium norvegicum]
MKTDDVDTSKSEEIEVFLFTTVIAAPFLAIAIVGGFGFAVWFSQMIFGPPTV